MNKKNIFVATGIVLIGMFSYSPSVLATGQETTATVNMKAGTLTVSVPENVEMSSHTINGSNGRVGEVTPSVIEVKDYRGSSTEGWALNAVANFQDTTDMQVAVSPKLLSNNTVAGVLPAYTSINWHKKVVVISDDYIANAEPITRFNPGFEFYIPADTKAGTYTAQITWDLVTSPTV
ncbi:hypothetical protein [Enterococcus sp. DIV1420a]|uniref:hypothetical protein n=1 Tax=Enterococcus sp. DIV1420a TaxID=2774672 RepID=UPI003F2744C2